MAPHITGPLNYERLGKHGPPMVFVHPNPMDRDCWIYQMSHFSTWYRCMAIDLPGYGRSPTAVAGLTMPDVAQACWEAVDDAFPGEDACILVGLSVGSNVVPHMYHLRPAQTSALILSGTGMPEGPGPKAFAQKRIAQYGEQGVGFRRAHALEDLSPSFRETPMGQYFADLFAERNPWADAFTIIEMFRALGEPDPEWLQRDIKAPTLIIKGSQDGDVSRAFALRDAIAGAEIEVIEGAGHCCNMEQPWLWDSHALRFLKAHALRPAFVLAPAGAATPAPV
jgi:pimeloyl-ACP methyl ester carboxylesterase